MSNKTAMTAFNRKDHYLSQTYLRAFIDPEVGKLRILSQGSNYSELKKPEDICHEIGFDDPDEAALSKYQYNNKTAFDHWQEINPNKKRAKAESSWSDDLVAIEKKEFNKANKRSMSLLLAIFLAHNPSHQEFIYQLNQNIAEFNLRMMSQFTKEQLVEYMQNKKTCLATGSGIAGLNQTKEDTRVLTYLIACELIMRKVLFDQWIFLSCPNSKLVASDNLFASVKWPLTGKRENYVYMPLTPKLGLLLKDNEDIQNRFFPAFCPNIIVFDQFRREDVPKIDKAYDKKSFSLNSSYLDLTDQEEIDYLNMMLVMTRRDLLILPKGDAFVHLGQVQVERLRNKCDVDGCS